MVEGQRCHSFRTPLVDYSAEPSSIFEESIQQYRTIDVAIAVRRGP
jgi:hypothetical protein